MGWCRLPFFKHVNFIALPYPGYPTDMQPQLVTFLSTVPGTSSAREGVWDDRFRYINQLKRMGAHIRVEGKLAIIDGVEKLNGAHVSSGSFSKSGSGNDNSRAYGSGFHGDNRYIPHRPRYMKILKKNL